MIEDWELGTLFLKEVDRLGSDDAAAKSVKDKFLGDCVGKIKDTPIFYGYTFPLQRMASCRCVLAAKNYQFAG